ncbi:hypothetical protein FACS1894189_2100 [Planctomycetales bacterium]|nr:hypothetical protein FACS1894189_2100 [Planctomycetales bacterium]
MDKKISRRVVLGTAIGCLVAGPFVVRALRKKNSLGYIVEKPYDKFVVDPRIVDSALPKDELEKAFDMFFAERDMWLSFRGIRGRISITTESPEPLNNSVPKVCQGFVQLNLVNVVHDGNRGRVPFDTELIFSKSQDDSPEFTYFSDRNKNKNELKGDQAPCFDPSFVSQLLVISSEIFSGFSNTVIRDMVTGYWTITEKNGAYVFKSNEKLTNDGCLAPELEITNGHINKFVPKRYAGKPYVVISFESLTESNGFSYPNVLQFSLNQPESVAENTNAARTTIRLSDLHVTRS